MQTKPNDIDVVLPYGEALRPFLEQTFLSKADLKAILRSRGVFVCRSEKADTIPILVSSLLSPREFDSLRDRQTSKEDNPKRNSRFLDWNSTKSLIECIPEDLKLNELIKNEFVNYKVIGSPTFAAMGRRADHVRLDFEIERHDLSKSWCLSKQKFRASIELKRVEANVVKLLITHTAQETKALTQKITKQLTTHFRAQRLMPPEGGVSQILSGDFTNLERAEFFASLTDTIKHDWFEFEKITDVDVCLDPATTPPRELQLFMRGVDELKVRGKLQEHPFIKNKQYHTHLFFSGMEVRFRFAFEKSRGVCSVSYEFSEFDRGHPSNCEFELNISQLAIDLESPLRNKLYVKEQLLSEIDTFAHSQYKRITSRQELPPVVSTGESDGVLQQRLAI